MRISPRLIVLTVFLLGSLFMIYSAYTKPETPREISSTVPQKSVQGDETNSAQVKDVIDGDTVILTSGEKVRLIGINAPERAQPEYAESKQELESLVLGKNIDLQTDVTKIDAYGRTLGYIYIDDTFINLEMVKNGLAIIETIPPNVKHADDLTSAQKSARDNCKGIWEGLCSQTISSCVQISSINAKPSGVDSKSKNSEWIEVLNTCSETKNLAGYLLKDSSASNSYTFKNVTLSPKQKIKLHSGCGTNTIVDIYWVCPEQKNNVWNNTGDHAYLYDSAGKLVSDLGY